MVFGLVKVCFYEPIKKRQNIRFFPIPPPVCRNPWFTPCMQNAFLHSLQKTWINFENMSNSFSIVSILQSNCFPHKTIGILLELFSMPIYAINVSVYGIFLWPFLIRFSILCFTSLEENLSCFNWNVHFWNISFGKSSYYFVLFQLTSTYKAKTNFKDNFPVFSRICCNI